MFLSSPKRLILACVRLPPSRLRILTSKTPKSPAIGSDEGSDGPLARVEVAINVAPLGETTSDQAKGEWLVYIQPTAAQGLCVQVLRPGSSGHHLRGASFVSLTKTCLWVYMDSQVSPSPLQVDITWQIGWKLSQSLTMRPFKNELQTGRVAKNRNPSVHDTDGVFLPVSCIKR